MLATSEAALVRLDASLAVEKQALQAATDARDAAQRELGQADKRYRRCAAAQGQRPKQTKGVIAGDSSHGPRRQLQVKLEESLGICRQ